MRYCGNTQLHTWRAEAEKQRRWAWEKACLAANMMTVIEVQQVGWTG